MGFTFNNMTMLALSLSIGILVDDAIVVIENIHRHLEMGKPPMQAAADGTGEIGLAVLATTFSIVAVFVPVAVMKGIIGRFFFQFGLTVSFAVLVSLLVSFTLTPMMSARILRRAHNENPNIFVRASERFLGAIDNGYRRMLGAALRHRAITVSIALASLVGSVVVVGPGQGGVPARPRTGPSSRSRSSCPPAPRSTTTSKYVETIAGDLRKNGPGVNATFVTVGGGAQGQVNIGQIQVLMVRRTSRAYHQEDAMAWVRSRYQGVKNALFSVNPMSPMGNDGGFKQQAIQFNIRGRDMAELEKTSAALLAELKKSPGIVDLDSATGAASRSSPSTSIATAPPSSASRWRPSPPPCGPSWPGDKVTELKQGMDLYDVTVQLPAEQKKGLASLSNLAVRSSTGQLVSLSQRRAGDPGRGPQPDRPPGPAAADHHLRRSAGAAPGRGDEGGQRRRRQGGARAHGHRLRRHG